MKSKRSQDRLVSQMLPGAAGLAALFLCLLLSCISTWAAINRGAIQGTVTDPQGAVMAGTAVTITNTSTGVAQKTQTNATGFYFVPELIPGAYRVHIEMSGFKVVDINDVAVKADDTATVDAQLTLGAAVQRVEVTATNPLVETAPSNFSTTIEQRYMEDLPMLGNDIQSMVQLIPGVTQTSGPPGTLVGFNGGQYGGFPDPTHIIGSMISVNGSQGGANIWYLDGNVNAAQDMDNVVVDPPPDAVAEFQAVTNGLAPEYGRTSGGVFNVVLKSGSNAVHGDLYEFNRNSFFSARNPFAGYDPFGHQRPPNPVNWNQFGGTLGGPVTIPHVYSGKDRTFFFAAWDISRLFAHAPSLSTVPTLLERTGNFSEFPSIAQYGIYDPLSTKFPVDAVTATRQPFLNPDGSLATSLPANRIDPVASWFMSQFPAPNFLDPRQQNAAAGGCLNTCNNFSSVYGSSDVSQSVVVKVDHTISERDKVFVEWLYNPTTYSMFELPWTGATANRSGFSGGVPWHVGNEIAALGNTTTFSPTLVNEFRLMYSRQADYPLPLPASEINDAGVSQHLAGLNIPTFPPIQTQPAWGISGLPSFGSPFNPQIQITQAFTLLDNLTKVLSKHTIKAGFMYRDDITATTAPTQPYLSFGGSLTDNPVTAQGGSGPAQFLLGAVDQSSYVRFIGGTMGNTNQVGAYVQDDFRISPKFTLNIGLRWDMQGWYNDRHNNDSIFEWNVPNPVLPQYQGAIVYMGTPQHPSSRPWPAHHNDFSPRINFVYSPFADHKTVFRGGFDYIYTDGLSQLLGQGEGASESPGYNAYLRFPGDATGQGLNNTNVVPSFILSQGASTPPTFVNPKTTATSNPANYQWLGSAYGGFLSQMQNSHDPTVTMWNFQVQRELPWNMSIVAGYIGQKGTSLIAGNNTAFDYVHTADILQYKSQLNALVPMPAALVPYFGANYYQSELLRAMPQWPGFSNFLGEDASNVYHGFQLKVEKRVSQGLNFLVAYTAQKNIANASFGAYLSNTWTGGSGFAQGRGVTGNEWEQGIGYGGVGGEYQNLDNRKADRGLVPDDLPQVFNMAWTYQLPFGPGKAFAGTAHGVTRYLIQGWKFSDNINIEPGIPQTMTAPSNGLTSRPDLIGNPNAGRSGKSRYQQEQQWWNPYAFQAPFGSSAAEIAVATSGTPAQKDALPSWYVYGTEGIRNGSIRLPPFWNMDMDLAKDFRVTESKTFQFRVVMFNALNHQNLGLPNENWCLPPNSDGSVDAVHKFGCSFGKISSIATDPRSLQVALKFLF